MEAGDRIYGKFIQTLPKLVFADHLNADFCDMSITVVKRSGVQSGLRLRS